MKVMLKHEITCPAGKWASKDSQIALFEEYAQSGSMKTAVLMKPAFYVGNVTRRSNYAKFGH